MDLPLRAQGDGPALIRLLARMGGVAPAPPPPSLSSRLAQWIDWREAVALSEALEPRAMPGADADEPVDDAADCARVRAALAEGIRADRAFQPAAAPPDDAAFYRQRYVALQHLMAAEAALLRKRLRARLARRALQDLAEMDAVMEQALARQERLLLAGVPDLLARHFDALRGPPATGGSARPTTAAPPWLDRFRRDMQALLLAELDFRLQPVEGLLAALRPDTRGSHAP